MNMNKPNILFIMSDDHSAKAISSYDSALSQVFQTPAIDRLAEEGIRMKHFFSTNSVCTPARASIMTGQYGHINGVRTLEDAYDSAGLNLAQIFKDHDYQTSIIGKWHLHSSPEGFDDFKVLSGEHGQGTYFDPEFNDKDGGKVRRKGYVTDIITDLTHDAIKNRDRSKPFMMMCHHKAPHDFWEYAKRHEHLLDGQSIPEPESLFEDRSHRSLASRDYGSSVTPRSQVRSLYHDFLNEGYVTGPLKGTEAMSFEEKGHAAYQKYLKDYLRTVAAIDESVASLYATLEEEGILEDTILIYTSDQGMFLGEHDYQDKRWSYEESLQAPFIIRYGHGFPRATVIEHLMANVDIAPTLLDMCGLPIPNEMQGISMKTCFEENVSLRDAIYFRYWMHLAHRHHNPAHYGIRTDKYKLIFYYGLPLDATGGVQEETPPGWELYDLEKDPCELNNCFDHGDYLGTRQTLKKKLFEMKETLKDTDDQYEALTALLRV